MKLLKNIYLTGAAVVLLTGCQGDLMDLNPYDSISSGNMWATENLADMGVNGIYNVLRSDNVAGDLHKFDSYGVSADYRDGNYALLRGNATTSNSQFSDYWKIHYEGVSRTNDAIANLSKAQV